MLVELNKTQKTLAILMIVVAVYMFLKSVSSIYIESSTPLVNLGLFYYNIKILTILGWVVAAGAIFGAYLLINAGYTLLKKDVESIIFIRGATETLILLNLLEIVNYVVIRNTDNAQFIDPAINNVLVITLVFNIIAIGFWAVVGRYFNKNLSQEELEIEMGWNQKA